MMASMTSSLAGKVCIVTGATRGIGKGIAVQLGEKGAKVYITGRTLDPPEGSKVVGSLRETSEEIKTRGGDCTPVLCDHSKDVDTERLFEQIKRENDGQLDILVNNAYSAVGAIFSNMGLKFWDQPLSLWDTVNDVGLRSHYICSVYAARMMVPRKHGLVINISAVGGLRYLFDVPYGVGKEACDRMAVDCAQDLRSSGVAFLSLWPGPVATEELITKLKDGSIGSLPGLKGVRDPNAALHFFQSGESPEFVGQCVAALASDPNIMKKSGKIIMTYDLGQEYGLRDKEGHKPTDMCSMKFNFSHSGHSRLATITPSFLRFPKWILALGGNKF